MAAVEDRVFGTPQAFPAPTLTARASTTFDLVSVPVEGADVVYAAEGSTTRPPLVFVHGWGASHKFWKYVFPAFSGRFRCLAPDLVGYGLSEKPRRDYSIEGYARWLGGFLDALGIERATIVAHSMGGTIALEFALTRPERVGRLVVVNPVVQGNTAFSGLTRILCLPGVRNLAWLLARMAWFRRLVTGDFSLVQQLEEDMVDDVMRGTYQSTFEPLRSLFAVDLAHRVGGLAMDTLAVGTDHDQVVTPGQHEMIHATRTETIEGCGHIPMVEKPLAFNKILDDFLTSNPKLEIRNPK